MPRKRMTDYIFSAVCDIALLIVVNKVPDWNIVFITKVATIIICQVDMRSGEVILKKESSLFSMIGKNPSKD